MSAASEEDLLEIFSGIGTPYASLGKLSLLGLFPKIIRFLRSFYVYLLCKWGIYEFLCLFAFKFTGEDCLSSLLYSYE